MKVMFVMNPASGVSGNEEEIALINEKCKGEGLDCKIYHTSGDNDEQNIRHELNEFSPDRIVACGGDGTVQLVARCLIDTDSTLGIVPTGSANGLATALDIPMNIENSLNIALDSHNTVPLDLLSINNKYICTHLSDIGTNALLVKNYEQAGDKGMLGYAKHLISSIQQSDLMRFEIHTDEGTFIKEGYMLMIANAHKYGTGVQISEGNVSDGKFEICNVRNIDLESAIKAGLTAANIFVDKDMFSDVISCRNARVSIQPAAHLQIDGEYIGEFSELNVHILASAIKVLVAP